MLDILAAFTGEVVTSYEEQHLQNSTVSDLKQSPSLVTGLSRFRLRILHGLTILENREPLMHDHKIICNSLLLVNLGFEEENREKEHAMVVACMNNDYEALESFLYEPQNPNFFSISEQVTPLYIACSRGNLECVSLILEAGGKADVGCRVSGESPLFRAALEWAFERCQDKAYGPRALHGKVPEPGHVLKEYLLEPVGADMWMKAIAFRTNIYSQCHVEVFRKRRDQLPVLEYADRNKKKRKRPVGDYDDDGTSMIDVPMPPMPQNPSEYGQLFTWASCLLLRFEAFFGAEEVKGKLQATCFCLDSFFTGADFPSIALEQIDAAVRRRMGKNEGMDTTNLEKKLVHDVYVADKNDQQLDWFVHENSTNFPKEYLEEAFGNKYACEETWISPQRFGKPMNRCEVVISIVFVIAIDKCCLHRLRSYKVYYLKSKYQWRGPPLRQLLKALLPLQPLEMDADALFFMTKSELEAWLSFIIGNIFFGFLEISIVL
eukprot:symbB.v1.2.014267.t1/scaffold1033.1/size247163/5